MSLETCQHPERDKRQCEECGRSLDHQLPAPSGLRPEAWNQVDHLSPSGTTFPVSKARCVLDELWLEIKVPFAALKNWSYSMKQPCTLIFLVPLALFSLDRCFLKGNMPEAVAPTYPRIHTLPACTHCTEWRAVSMPGSR